MVFRMLCVTMNGMCSSLRTRHHRLSCWHTAHCILLIIVATVQLWTGVHYERHMMAKVRGHTTFRHRSCSTPCRFRRQLNNSIPSLSGFLVATPLTSLSHYSLCGRDMFNSTRTEHGAPGCFRRSCHLLALRRHQTLSHPAATLILRGSRSVGHV
jgi:hypothetical protein